MQKYGRIPESTYRYKNVLKVHSLVPESLNDKDLFVSAFDYHINCL